MRRSNNTSCTLRASAYSKSTPSQPYHMIGTQQGRGTVESTLVRWSALRYPRSRHSCWESFQCALSPSAHKCHTSIRAKSLAHILLTHTVKRVRQDYCFQSYIALQYRYHIGMMHTRYNVQSLDTHCFASLLSLCRCRFFRVLYTSVLSFLYGHYVVRFPLSDGVSYLMTTGWSLASVYSVRVQSINQSRPLNSSVVQCAVINSRNALASE